MLKVLYRRGRCGIAKRRGERVSSREEVAQNVLMTYMAKLQDALQETVVAIGDVIKVQASEMRKLHDARKYSWDVEHAAVADVAQDLDHNIQLQTKELQKLDEARERAWHVERAAAVEQMAGARFERVESQVKQLPERTKSEIRAEARDASVAKARVDELHDDGSVAKTKVDELQRDASRHCGYSRGRHEAAAGRREQVYGDDHRASKSEWMRNS